ncbi:DsbA family protein [Sneathiella chinensis]|uniref:DSBA oxidoreductase n=1 Tax=Sneathiella chinensis TaxID=349750 RepID=A0ABQ5U4N2_9PROT|nr:DsbA family protein [Sneathiella chinensis]GLQ07057.1 DSBA oxidoreductase [Sneathiella chinensis]
MKKNSKLSLLSIVLLIALAGMAGLYAYQFLSRGQGAAATQAGMSTPVSDEFGSRVRAYLLQNPEVIREVITALQLKEAQEAAAQKTALLDAMRPDLEQDGYSYVAGNPNGDVTVVEFFDYRCGYCKKSFPDVMKLVKDDGNIRLVLKEFPVLGDPSMLAAQAAMAALKQEGKYMDFHVALMETRAQLSEDRVFAIAEETGLNIEQLKADMKDDDIQENLSKTYQQARALGISGTPTFIIGSELAPGAIPIAQMKALVDTAREKNKTAAAKN